MGAVVVDLRGGRREDRAVFLQNARHLRRELVERRENNAVFPRYGVALGATHLQFTIKVRPALPTPALRLQKKVLNLQNLKII